MESRPAMAIFELLDYIVNEVCALGLRELLSGPASPPWVFPGARGAAGCSSAVPSQ